MKGAWWGLVTSDAGVVIQWLKSRCSVNATAGSPISTARAHVPTMSPADVSHDHSLCTWLSPGNVSGMSTPFVGAHASQREMPARRRTPDTQANIGSVTATVERSFQTARSGRRVPAMLWLPPPASAPAPLVLNDRFRAVVLGKFGLQANSALHPGLAAPARFAADAAHITAPLLFHIQDDDEVFPRGGQRELFDLIGSPVKEMITEPGPHARTTPTAIARWRTFVAEHLTDAGQRS